MGPGLKQQRFDGEVGEARLTVKQARFALEYVKDGNATRAAVRAGYSDASAGEIGYENLTKPHVLAAVSAALHRHLANLDLSVERIIQEAARVGISDIRELFDPESKRLLLPTEMPDNIARAIASIKVTQKVTAGKDDDEPEIYTTTEVKLWDKLRGLELIGKLKGLLRPIPVQLEAGDSWKAVLLRMHAEDQERRVDDA